MTRVQLAALFICLSAFGCDPVQPAAVMSPVAAVTGPLDVTLAPAADTYLREWAPNQNQGSETTLRLQNVGNNRALLQWTPDAVGQAVGNGALTSARIELSITSNGNNWGLKGRTIDLHRMNQWWIEEGATWNCAIDANLANYRADCSGSTAWEMDHPTSANPWVGTPSATQTIRNGQSGVVTFDVTADIRAMLDHQEVRYGWILKKTDEGQNGRVEFGSRESGSPPKLILTVAAAALPQRLLTVADTGVTALPSSPVGTYPKGTLVPYAFVAQPGFTNVQVQLDGSPIPASGSVTMDTTRVLMASADRAYALVPGTEGLLASAQNLLTASDPVSAFQAHLDLIGDYIGSVAPGVADEALAAVYALAFDETRDSAGLDRLDEALGGHVFEIALGPTRASLAFPAGAAPGDSAEPTVYLYVNGIWTGATHALSTRQTIATIVESQRELNTSRARVRLFYNRTRSSQLLTAEQEHGLCVYLAYEQLRSEGILGYRALLDRCLAGQHFSDEDDLVEAVRQWIDVHFRPTHFEEDARRLAESIAGFRGEGSHVILVPHSQGNLMAQQALNLLDRADSLFPDSTFIGAVALASPSSEGWPLDEVHLLPVTLRGDLIPDAGLNSWPRLESGLSEKRDAIARLLSLDPFNLLPVFVAPLIKGYFGIQLHKIDQAYLGQPEVRDTIINDVVQLYREATVGSIRCVGLGQFFPGRSRNLANVVTVLNRNGRSQRGRHLEWTTSDSSVVRVSEVGQMTTLAPGSATITVRSWQVSCDMPVEIVPPPDLAGRWTGTWQRTSAGSVGSGNVTLVLAQAGTGFTGNVNYTFDGAAYGSDVVGVLTSPVGATPVVQLSMQAAEYAIPLPDYTFSINLRRTNSSLVGSGTINYHGIPNGETRDWILQKQQTP